MTGKSSIDPDFWLTIVNEREPKSASVTDWFSGNVSPVRPGYYDRHYTDGVYRHYISTMVDGHTDLVMNDAGRLLMEQLQEDAPADRTE